MKRFYLLFVVVIGMGLVVCSREHKEGEEGEVRSGGASGGEGEEGGWLVVTSTPTGVEVYLDNTFTGLKTNCRLKVRSKFGHVVKVKSDTYDSQSQSCSVETGDTAYLRFTLYKLWKKRALYDIKGGYVCNGLTLGQDGTIYFPVFGYDNNGYLYAVTPQGQFKWRYGPVPFIYSPASLDKNGAIYFTSIAGNGPRFRLYCVSSDGKLKWMYEDKGFSSTLPAVGTDGTVYVIDDGNNLHALNPDGSLKWKYGHVNYSERNPTISMDGRIYIGSQDGNFYSLTQAPAVVWRYELKPSIFDGPSFGEDGTVYVGGGKGLCAFTPEGKLKWIFECGGICQPVIGADGTIYAGEISGNSFYAVRPDGSLKWKYDLEHQSIYTPALIDADGCVYFVSSDDYLYAFDSCGNFKWRLDTEDDMVASPVIGQDGIIYVNGNHRIWAVETGSAGLASSPWPKYQHDNQNTGNAAWPVR